MENCMNLRNDFLEKTCLKCGKLLKGDWGYCPYCTTEVHNTICSCGRLLQVNWQFCPYCKKQISNEINEKKEDSNEWLSNILRNK